MSPALAPFARLRSRLNALQAWGARRATLYYLGPPVVWCVVVLALSLAPPSPRIRRIDVPNLDKLGHALMYTLLGALIVRAIVRRRAPRAGALAVAVVLAGLYGLALEGLQGLTSWRTFDPFDALANLLGAGLGVALWSLVSKGLAKAPAAGEDVNPTAPRRPPR
ncbi:MAG TPA: VanZ family protein [Candidatus Sumerlaeota bacterium]|nr:MAG: VanZ like family protein [candidate division BRC1 bacterium ADurb.BinA292]HOE97028.1 VanZ family protein [Candidatus Sumerlaeota bacterium]HOR28385.1 VanZ family protein [Candidatus Sumerlaeota bacterium]HPK03217.1 VanZ family protein [Candidatus Sumerlaeota bacterium]